MSANYKSVLTVPMFLPNHTVAMTNRSFFQRSKHSLILSSVQSNTDTFANSVDPESSYRDLRCLPFSYWFFMKPLFATMDVSNFRSRKVHYRKSGVKGLTSYLLIWSSCLVWCCILACCVCLRVEFFVIVWCCYFVRSCVRARACVFVLLTTNL